jgi:hypothetical protein
MALLDRLTREFHEVTVSHVAALTTGTVLPNNAPTRMAATVAEGNCMAIDSVLVVRSFVL